MISSEEMKKQQTKKKEKEQNLLTIGLEKCKEFDFNTSLSLIERGEMLFKAASIGKFIIEKAELIEHYHSIVTDKNVNVTEAIKITYDELWILEICNCARIISEMAKMNVFTYEKMGQCMDLRALEMMHYLLDGNIKKANTLSVYIFGEDKTNTDVTTLYDEILTRNRYSGPMQYASYNCIRAALRDIILLSRNKDLYIFDEEKIQIRNLKQKRNENG